MAQYYGLKSYPKKLIRLGEKAIRIIHGIDETFEVPGAKVDRIFPKIERLVNDKVLYRAPGGVDIDGREGVAKNILLDHGLYSFVAEYCEQEDE